MRVLRMLLRWIDQLSGRAARRQFAEALGEAEAASEYASTLVRAAQHPGEWQHVPAWAQRPGGFTAIRWKTQQERANNG